MIENLNLLSQIWEEKRNVYFVMLNLCNQYKSWKYDKNECYNIIIIYCKIYHRILWENSMIECNMLWL